MSVSVSFAVEDFLCPIWHEFMMSAKFVRRPIRMRGLMVKHGRSLQVGASLTSFRRCCNPAVGGFSLLFLPMSQTAFGPFGQIEISKQDCRLKNHLIVGKEEVCI